MPTSSTITDLRLSQDGADLIVAWSSSAVPGSLFQVYVDRHLAWQGRGRRCHAPMPVGPEGRPCRVDVIEIEPKDAGRDLSERLFSPAGSDPRVTLSWLGGTYLDPSGQDDIQGFRIFTSTRPGGEIDYSVPVGTVPAYPGGWLADGFGLGGYGQGGFGRSAGRYSWQSEPLSSGTWNFAIVPYDRAGDERGEPLTASRAIQAAPAPPIPGPEGRPLKYTYTGPTSRMVVLTWQHHTQT